MAISTKQWWYQESLLPLQFSATDAGGGGDGGDAGDAGDGGDGGDGGERRPSLTVCVGPGVPLQELHVFAVQLLVELLQRVVPLTERRLQAQDALHVLLHQAGLQPLHTLSLLECYTRFKPLRSF